MQSLRIETKIQMNIIGTKLAPRYHFLLLSLNSVILKAIRGVFYV